MTITQVEIFIKISELNSFTKAGEELGMSQSAVSHSILKLEDELNILLFNRSTNFVTLTPMGNIIYENMKNILNNIEEIYLKTENKIFIKEKSLKLGVFPSISTYIMPRIIKLFKQLYPKLKIILFEGTENEIKEWLRKEMIDLGFITLPNSEFNIENLIQDEIFVVFNEKSNLSNESSLKINNLLKENKFILPKQEFDITQKENLIDKNIEIEYRISNFSTIIEMVKEGLGITILPELTLKNSKLDNLKICSLNPRSYRKICIASKDKIIKDSLKSIFVEKIKYIIKRL